MKRAYIIPTHIDPTSLPWVFDTEQRSLTVLDGGYVEVEGSIEGYPEVAVRAAPKPAVPQTVSPRQLRRALTQFGWRADVEAAVAAGSQDLKDDWEFATSFDRGHETIAALAAALGKTSEQIDDLFIAAAEIR